MNYHKKKIILVYRVSTECRFGRKSSRPLEHRTETVNDCNRGIRTQCGAVPSRSAPRWRSQKCKRNGKRITKLVDGDRKLIYGWKIEPKSGTLAQMSNRNGKEATKYDFKYKKTNLFYVSMTMCRWHRRRNIRNSSSLGAAIVNLVRWNVVKIWFVVCDGRFG